MSAVTIYSTFLDLELNWKLRFQKKLASSYLLLQSSSQLKKFSWNYTFYQDGIIRTGITFLWVQAHSLNNSWDVYPIFIYIDLFLCFNFDEVWFIYFSFIACVLVSHLRNHCLTQGHEDLHLRFLLSVFTVWGITLSLWSMFSEFCIQCEVKNIYSLSWCSDVFMGIYTCQNLTNCTYKIIHSLLYDNYTSINPF